MMPLSDIVIAEGLYALSPLAPAVLPLRVGGFVRRPYMTGDEHDFEPRADFLAEWLADPTLPAGPKWALCDDRHGWTVPPVVGVGGLEPVGERIWNLWGFSAHLNRRGWAAVRSMASDACCWAEAALGARLIHAAVPANRPEAAALLARLDFEQTGEAAGIAGDRLRMMERRA